MIFALFGRISEGLATALVDTLLRRSRHDVRVCPCSRENDKVRINVLCTRRRGHKVPNFRLPVLLNL